MLQNNPNQQKGIVLLGFVIFIIMGVLAYYFNTLSVVEIKQRQLEVTSKALQQAKQALIAYALVYGDIDGDGDAIIDFPGEYGFLPCPDYSNNILAEGIEDNGTCLGERVPVIGYFPWATLDVPALKDSSGTCLMYAVSGEYKNKALNKTKMLNEDSNGLFQIINQAGNVVQGGSPEDRIVAIIFAPGKALSGQNRTFLNTTLCGRDYGNTNAYLEVGGGVDNSDVSAVKDLIDQFIHATAPSVADTNPNPYNDRFVTITREEIWSAIRLRSDFNIKMANLTEALALCLENYAADASNIDRQLPWPAPLTLGNYRINANYDDNVDETLGYAGRFPFLIDSSRAITGNLGSDVLFENASCNNLLVSSGDTVDLQTAGAEYRRLWENWKDHFFYTVSKGYAPDSVAVPATCGTCIEVNTTERSAMVIFSGTRQGNQVRNEPLVGPDPDPDTKLKITNYMENGNEADFIANDGEGEYFSNIANEFSYCLDHGSPPVAVSCI